MSLNGSSQTGEKDGSLLQSDAFHRIFGGDAMQALRCGICMEFFEVPIVLPCGHTFCLHCLTELCRQAMQTTTPTCPIQETRIGCPHCRVLIYASPILDRNVTCNFVIQSLIESLKERKAESRLNKAVNTDEARIGTKIRLVGDLEIDRIVQEVDRLSDAIGKRSVLDMAYFEVDQIRREHLAAEGINRMNKVEDSLPPNPWKTGSCRPQTHAGLQTQQQKQWTHLMQQQKCAQHLLSHQQQQQQHRQSTNFQHHYNPQQLLNQRSSQREPIRASGSAWSHHSNAQSSRFVPPGPESSSFPSQPSSTTVFSTASSSSVGAFSAASLHTPSSCSRQQTRTHHVHPAIQQQRQIQLLQRQEPQQPPQQLQLQQPQTSQSFFQIRRKQELYQPQHQQQQQSHQDCDKKQKYFLQQQHQQQNKSHRLLQRPTPYQAHSLHVINQQHQQHQPPHQQQQEQASGSKMAAVVPVPRSLGMESNELVSSNHNGHSARLDNDPAVMSYSYRTEPVSRTESNSLP